MVETKLELSPKVSIELNSMQVLETTRIPYCFCAPYTGDSPNWSLFDALVYSCKLIDETEGLLLVEQWHTVHQKFS